MKILFGQERLVHALHQSINQMTCSHTPGKIVCRKKARFFLTQLQTFRVQGTLFEGGSPFSEPPYSLGKAPCGLPLVDLPGVLDNGAVQSRRGFGRHRPDAQDGLSKALKNAHRREERLPGVHRGFPPVSIGRVRLVGRLHLARFVLELGVRVSEFLCSCPLPA